MEGLTLSKYQEIARQSKIYGETQDCSVMAIALTYDISYQESHRALAKCGRIAGHGFYTRHALSYLTEQYGIAHTYIDLPKQLNGSRYTNKTIANFLPVGNYLIFVKGHVLPMINGKIYDWSDGRKFVVKRVCRIGDGLLGL